MDGSLCGLGRTAPNPVLTSIRYFRDEYLAHIVDHNCPAGVCRDLITYRIDPEICNGCTLCATDLSPGVHQPGQKRNPIPLTRRPVSAVGPAWTSAPSMPWSWLRR